MVNNRNGILREKYRGIEIKTGLFYPGNDPENGPAAMTSVWYWPPEQRHEAETILQACADIDKTLGFRG